ncbi:hypothetical protein BEL04_01715 [Mucilaginibacter sp. PPCGB 2223]|uniref:L-rhamnose mutarotase n=1 Tax=Mucilaginibacter sp. PPCGB 2223 TaxID=1886027 RepID=UPI000826EA83|nr:L-rhamnose mutarotase [Mucilaginibacter sp. PPCGB 2223]OCX53058.1 hypothetical protein BEL04_01715 [Mucilaginibacter sp. PPCGB 2223]
MGVNKIYKYLYCKVLTILLISITLLYGSCKQAKRAVITVSDSTKMQVIEIIKHDGSEFSKEWLYGLCDGYKIKRENIFEWQNRVVILADKRSLENGEFKYWLNHRLHFPQDTIVYFNKPFYIFNRSVCSDTVSSKNWDNIILTANLVSDPGKQAEYMEYHRTQFEKWPEVSQGFCNASFQQLLVFRNGRQLMLIISIPQGESLDKLNPLTTKNNPRVDEWNKIMAKYQEGIPGTKPGETWVFLKPI